MYFLFSSSLPELLLPLMRPDIQWLSLPYSVHGHLAMAPAILSFRLCVAHPSRCIEKTCSQTKWRIVRAAVCIV